MIKLPGKLESMVDRANANPKDLIPFWVDSFENVTCKFDMCERKKMGRVAYVLLIIG